VALEKLCNFSEAGYIKQFFFEKKNQKTSAPLRALFKAPGIN
jgi:hypothetical protein